MLPQRCVKDPRMDTGEFQVISEKNMEGVWVFQGESDDEPTEVYVLKTLKNVKKRTNMF